jgi:hypothetical protein
MHAYWRRPELRNGDLIEKILPVTAGHLTSLDARISSPSDMSLSIKNESLLRKFSLDWAARRDRSLLT